MTKSAAAPAAPTGEPVSASSAPSRRFQVRAPVEYRRRGADDAAAAETWWQPLGVALEYPARDGKPASIVVFLNALPLPGPDGKVSMRLFLDDRRDRPADRGTAPTDDGIPF